MASSRRAALAAGLAALGVIGGALLLREPAASPDLEPAALEATLTNVLQGVYAAFAETDEARVYDGLARVAAGDIVAELYLQRRSAQVATHAEGAQSDVLSVEPTRVDAAKLPWDQGYRIDAAWRVVGRVRHATHVHERINLYTADLTLASVEGRWMLTDFALTDINRADDFSFEGGE